MEDVHLSVRILFIQPFLSLREKIFPLRSCPFSLFLSRVSHTLFVLTMVIHFLLEDPSLRRIPVVPQSQEAPFHELVIGEPCPRQSAARSSTILSRLAARIHHLRGRTTGVPFATKLFL